MSCHLYIFFTTVSNIKYIRDKKKNSILNNFIKYFISDIKTVIISVLFKDNLSVGIKCTV